MGEILINILNICVIVLYVLTIVHMYNKYTEFFIAMLIIIVYWAQLLVSSAYIETGVYLKDIGVVSYATGVTIRLFLQIELMLFIVMHWAKRWAKNTVNTEEEISAHYDSSKLNIGLFIIYAYRLLDILVSGNVLTNSGVTRFNYFSDISKFPFAQIVDYFSYPLLWIAGYNLIHTKNKKQKIIPIAILVINVTAMFLRGIQFGGYLQCAIYFLSPYLLKLAKKRKLLKFRNIAIATCLVVVMLIPKYNHFSEAIKMNVADTSFGLNTAYEFLMYRMLAQEADLTWAIDRQVIEEGRTEPTQYLYEMATLLGIKVKESTGTQYLMDRGCSQSALKIYSYGDAAVTGGYPVIWAALFGYVFAIPFWIIDATLLALILRCICEGIKRRRLIRLLAAAYILCQCYTIVLSANFSAIGNLIPHILIVFLILTHNRVFVYNHRNVHFRV